MPIPLGILAVAGAGGGAANSYELISTTVLGSDTSSITFSSIDQTYTHLQLRFSIRSTRTDAAENAGFIRLNNDSNSIYDFGQFVASGGSIFTQQSVSQARFNNIWFSASGSSQTTYCGLVVNIYDYASTVKNKGIMVYGGYANNAANRNYIYSGQYRTTSAISQINFTDIGYSLSSGTRISLYGIKG